MISIDSLHTLSEIWTMLMLNKLVSGTLLCALVGFFVWRFPKEVSPRLGVLLFMMILVKCIMPLEPVTVVEWPREPTSAIESQKAVPERRSSEPVMARNEVQRVFRNGVADPKEKPLAPAAVRVSHDSPLKDRGAVASGITLPTLHWPTVLMTLWLMIVVALFFRLGVQEWRTRRLLRASEPMDPNELPVSWSSIQHASGVHHPVRMYKATWVSSPFTAGIFAPSIYVPARFADMVSREEMRWILLHEMAHIRHRDPLIKLFQTIVQSLFFFHPAVWYSNRMIDRLREFACDETAVQGAQVSRATCGEGLLRVVQSARASLRPVPGALHLVHPKPILKERMMRILNPIHVNERLYLVAGFLLLFLMAMPVSLISLQAQSVDYSHQANDIDVDVVNDGTLPPEKFDIVHDGTRPPEPVEPSVNEDVDVTHHRIDIDTNHEIEIKHAHSVASVMPVVETEHVHVHHMRYGLDDEFLDVDDPDTIRGFWNAEMKSSGFYLDQTLRFGEAKIEIGETYKRHAEEFPELSELTPSSSIEDVRFAKRSEAGTLWFSGSFEQGMGSGTFEFEPSEDYRDEFNEFGLGSLTNRRQLMFAIHKVELGFVEMLLKTDIEGIDMDSLMEMAIHGVDEKYVTGMLNLDFEELTARNLVEMRIHGVDAEYVGALMDAGLMKVTPKTFVEMSIHGVDPDLVAAIAQNDFDMSDPRGIIDAAIHGVDENYIELFADSGLTDIRLKDIARMHIHGVDPEMLEALRAHDFEDFSVRGITDAAIHGVNPEYIETFANAGLTDMNLRALAQMKIHGVDADLVKKLRDTGFETISTKTITNLAIHSVDAEYIQTFVDAKLDNFELRDLAQMKIHGVKMDVITSMQDSGFGVPSVNDIVKASIHGINAEYIEGIAEAGYSDVSMNKLVEMKIHGVTPRFIEQENEEAEKKLSPGELVRRKMHW